MDFIESDRNKAINWAKKLIENSKQHPFVIFDTETTGLETPEIIDIAVLDCFGNRLMNQLVKPKGDITIEAYYVHKIGPEIVRHKPSWPETCEKFEKTIAGKILLSYNLEFDLKALSTTYKVWGMPMKKIYVSDCIMEWYSQFCGNWSEYHQSYTWKKLEGGNHRAMGDCEAALKIIKEMAQA